MATGDLTIAYNSSSVVFNQFSGEDLPRAYVGQASLEFSQQGVGYSNGPARRQRKIWTVAAYATQQQCEDTLAIFDAWDTERSLGTNTAEITVTDELFGSTITATGFFTTPPTIQKLGSGNDTLFLLTFGLTET